MKQFGYYQGWDSQSFHCVHFFLNHAVMTQQRFDTDLPQHHLLCLIRNLTRSHGDIVRAPLRNDRKPETNFIICELQINFPFPVCML